MCSLACRVTARTAWPDGDKENEQRPPAFVPANVGLFQRWRLDMAATWGNLEKLLADTAPDVASMVEFVGLLGKDGIKTSISSF